MDGFSGGARDENAARTLTRTDASFVGVRWSGATVPASALLFYCRKVPNHFAKLRLVRAIGRTLFRSCLRVANAELGIALQLDISDYVGHAIAFCGAYESLSVARAVQLMQRGGLFVDVGANFGLYTIPVASLPNVHCLAIDASFVALTRLRENIALNRLSNVTIVSAALSNDSRLVRLATPAAANLGTTRIVTSPLETSDGFLTSATTLQSVLEASGASGVELLKIDVEGHELHVLQGLDWTSFARPRNIILEFDPAAFGAAREAVEFLIGKGYDCRTVDGSAARLDITPPENNLWLIDSGRTTAPAGTGA